MRYLKYGLYWSIIIVLSFTTGAGIGKYGPVAAKKVVEHFEYYSSFEYQKIKLYEVYTRLRLHTGMQTVPLYVIFSPEVNAWTDGDSITFTSGILNFMNGDEDKIAAVLAHEMSHVMLRHVQEQEVSSLSITEKEAEADKMSAYLLLRSGFDVCKGRMFWKDLANYGDGDFADTENTVHPSYAYRYYALSMPWCPVGDYL
jgi:hypothetical protein